MPAPTVDPIASRLEEEALRLARHGSLPAAVDVCRTLNTRHPQFASGWRTASSIALQAAEPSAALALIERALALTPDDGRSLLQKAQCLMALRRPREGVAIANMARPILNEDAAALDSLGTLLSLSGEQQLALDAYERALQLAPRNPTITFNRAAVRRFLGQLEAAEEDYDRVISVRPTDCEAYLNRSELRRQTPDRNHVTELERLLASGIAHWRGEVQIRYALAKEYEDLAEYARSWSHLEQGAKLRRRHLQYDIVRDVSTVDWIIEAFPEAPAAGGGFPSEEPIFIIGLPRSGTTLVERILGSHSSVHPAGELNDFPQALVQAAARSGNSRPMPRRELVAASAKIDFECLGRDYLQRTRPATGRTARFTDKNPLNYLYCGIMHRALPKARIVHLTRHPLAVCYAMYKTLFKDGCPFSYDLQEIGRYYIAYRKLMSHWHATVPGAIQDLSYEQLVSDQIGETRRLLECCDLPWQDACLEFHRNPAPTTTASAPQVRRPLYDSSLAQWRHYAMQLEALRGQLLAAGIDVES
jgi:Sulfotransferase family/Tetratricopeptide repeat